MNAKKIAAEKAVEQIKGGMTIGLGTGSTAYWAIQKIGERVQEGLKIQAVATSESTEQLARQLNITITDFNALKEIDLAIDGADEVDPYKNLIKGGGGALLREKIIAFNSKRFLVVVDDSKLVEQLGKFLLPVEIVPFAAALTMQQISNLGGDPQLRKKDGATFITDNGNFIADCQFYPINDPSALNHQLHQIPGVVETGLFANKMVSNIYVGFENGEVRII